MAFWPPVDCLLYTVKEIVHQRVFHLCEGIQEYFRVWCLGNCPLLKKKKSDPEFEKVRVFRTTGCRKRIWIIVVGVAGVLPSSYTTWWKEGGRAGVELAGIDCSSDVSSQGISSVFIRSSWGMYDVSVSHGWETNQPTSCVWNFLRNSGRLGCFSLVSFWELTVG